jgi:cellulose synthase/poly-beta-1,6-N-acetylglucosamine synthase-like glycosyltransferase
MITIGIPTYNEEKTISKAIYSMLRQISKKDELIVVASGCTDKTVSKIKKIKDQRVKLIIEKERNGKSSAINLIIKNARGDIIVQTDGDVIVEKSAVKNLLKYFKNKKIGGVSGNPIPLIPKNNIFYDWTLMSYRRAGELREQESKLGSFWHMSGYLLAFRKDALNEVPFAKGAVDAWMGRIIQQNGYKIVYEPKSKVFVNAPLTINDFINQKSRVRAGYYFLIKKFGVAPRSITREIFWFPKEIINVPLFRWHKFLLSGFIYLFSWIKGWYLAKKNKSLSQIWKVPMSTKISFQMKTNKNSKIV